MDKNMKEGRADTIWKTRPRLSSVDSGRHHANDYFRRLCVQ